MKKSELKYIIISLIKASGKQESLEVPERKDTLHSKEKKRQDTINKVKKTNYGLQENTCKINNW